MQVRDSPMGLWIAYLSPSSPPSPKEPAWVSRLRAASSKLTAERFLAKIAPTAARVLPSACPKPARRDSRQPDFETSAKSSALDSFRPGRWDQGLICFSAWLSQYGPSSPCI